MSVGKGPTIAIGLQALPRPLQVRELFLELGEGTEHDKRFGPLVPPVRVGSARGNDVVLDDPTVSRFHLTIERDDEGLVAVDAGSKNGTFLGAVRIVRAYLAEGAALKLGRTTLKLSLGTTPRTLEMSVHDRFGPLYGRSALMRTLFATLGRLAQVDAPVLIEGETGTGKELVARALHEGGPRKDRPFVVVDCGAVAPSLVESELFGHDKGAFTGADHARVGAFEAAADGTVFLDEIGELPLALQPKLLRVLEASTIKPLGATRERPVRARVVAATHRDVRRMVNDGTFREDLYFRLAVCPVHVPPLRERPDDVTLLVRHFLHRALSAADGAPREVEPTAETFAVLAAQPFPGNVRELRNLVERAVILGDPDAVARGDLAGALRGLGGVERRAETGRLPLEEAKRRFEREYLVRLLERHAGDLNTAATEADVHPKSLARLLRRHGLRRANLPADDDGED